MSLNKIFECPTKIAVKMIVIKIDIQFGSVIF